MKWLIPSIYNAQGSRPIIVGVVQLGAVKIYVTAAAVETLSGKMKDRMKLSLSPKLMVF
jgi:hypothetical protein